MLTAMVTFNKHVQAWLADILGNQVTAEKHIHSHQDEVYRLKTPQKACYLKASPTLKAERDNLNRLKPYLNVPSVLGFCMLEATDYLLISELPGKNLVELIDDPEWSDHDIVTSFAEAVRDLHKLDVVGIFPGQASPNEVLLHGDMSLPNIIISTGSGKKRIGYIDFGQMAYGPPELELADAIWSLQRNLGPAYGELFLQAYGSVVMTPQIRKALDFRYRP